MVLFLDVPRVCWSRRTAPPATSDKLPRESPEHLDALKSPRYLYPISDFDNAMGTADKALYGGLIRLHILHHAAREPIFGLRIIEELARHGYKLSPGTMYPLLEGLEQQGYLRSSRQLKAGRVRRVYCATAYGRRALRQSKQRVKELFGELFEE